MIKKNDKYILRNIFPPALSIIGWIYALSDLIVPPECVGCGLIGTHFCENCYQKTKIIAGNICPICGSYLEEKDCKFCLEYPIEFQSAYSFAEYVDPFRSVVIHFKYQQNLSLGIRIAELSFPKIRELDWNVDLGAPVPLSARRQEERGYNQVDLFAKPLCNLLGMPYLPECLARIRETDSQVGLSSSLRQKNLEAAFRANPNLVQGNKVLLFDDVFTTGATANTCAAALMEAGATSVYVLTLARADGLNW